MSFPRETEEKTENRGGRLRKSIHTENMALQSLSVTFNGHECFRKYKQSRSLLWFIISFNTDRIFKRISFINSNACSIFPMRNKNVSTALQGLIEFHASEAARPLYSKLK